MKNKAFTEHAYLFYNLLSKRRIDQQRVKNIINLFKDYKIKSILDIGCGGGDITENLSNYGFGVTGIDNSIQMISIAKNQYKNSNVKWICQDIMSYKSNYNFDCFTAFYSFIQTLPSKKLINEFLSTIKKNVNPKFGFIEVQNEKVIKNKYPFNKPNSWIHDNYKIEAISFPQNKDYYLLKFTISSINTKEIVAIFEHKIFYFNIDTLRSLVEENGFMIEFVVDSSDFSSRFKKNESSGIGCFIRMR